MQRVILSALAAIALYGCTGDVTTKPLSAYDLTDRDIVNSVLSELSPQQRGPFLTYTIHHLASSKAFCGEVLIDKQGRQPSTVGDAIRLTVAREVELARKPDVVDPSKLNPVERYHFELQALQKEREQLIDRREDMLMIDPNVKNTSRHKEIEAKIATSSQEIAALRATAPAGAGVP
jgi:hypothetical protein